MSKFSKKHPKLSSAFKAAKEASFNQRNLKISTVVGSVSSVLGTAFLAASGFGLPVVIGGAVAFAVGGAGGDIAYNGAYAATRSLFSGKKNNPPKL